MHSIKISLITLFLGYNYNSVCPLVSLYLNYPAYLLYNILFTLDFKKAEFLS